MTLFVAANFATLRASFLYQNLVSVLTSYNFSECVFLYIVLSYPQYAASILAANDALRSIVRPFIRRSACSFSLSDSIKSQSAAAFLHAGTPMFQRLGIDGGVSLLAGLCCFGVPGIWLIWYYGATLRSRSRFAQGDDQ